MNSRRSSPAMLAFVRSAARPARRRARGRRPRSGQRRKETRADRLSAPSRAVLSSFLRRSETHFASDRKTEAWPPLTVGAGGWIGANASAISASRRRLAAQKPTRSPAMSRECPPRPDHRACRRRGRAHALEAAEGAARDRRALDARRMCWRRSPRRARATSRSSSGRTARTSRRRRAGRVPGVEVFVQRERRGTAHAVLAAREAIARGYDDILVTYADIPLIRGETLARLRAALAEGAGLVALGFAPADPTGLRPADRARRAARRDPRAQGRDGGGAEGAALQRGADRLRGRAGARACSTR